MTNTEPPSSRLDRIEAILADMDTQQARSIENGFVLLEPNIQVFERKPKAEVA